MAVNGARPWHRFTGIELRWLAVAVALLAVLALLGAVVTDRLPPLDSIVLAEFRGLQATPLWPLLQLANLVGYPAVWDTAVIGGAAVVTLRVRQAWPLILPAGLLLAEGAVIVAKLSHDRLRPPGVVIQDLVTVASFPSGHVTRVVVTVALAVAIAWPVLRQRRAALLAIIAAAALMGTSRMGAGEHWPTDVLGAYLLSGSVVAALLAVQPRGGWLPRTRSADGRPGRGHEPPRNEDGSP